MYTIDSDIKNEIIIKNSRFICLLKKIYTKEDALKFLDSVREDYPKATHYCYAYIISDYKHFSDDGEPGGTAGMPILNVLEKEEMHNIICIVIRYFGGIKLGAGGLVRAYSKSCKEALKLPLKRKLVSGYHVEITCNYDMQKKLDYILRNEIILKKEYQEIIKYNVLIESLDILEGYQYKIIEKNYIEK